MPKPVQRPIEILYSPLTPLMNKTNPFSRLYYSYLQLWLPKNPVAVAPAGTSTNTPDSGR